MAGVYKRGVWYAALLPRQAVWWVSMRSVWYAGLLPRQAVQRMSGLPLQERSHQERQLRIKIRSLSFA